MNTKSLDILHPLRTALVHFNDDGEYELGIKFGDYNNTDDFVYSLSVKKRHSLRIKQALDLVNRELFPGNMSG